MSYMILNTDLKKKKTVAYNWITFRCQIVYSDLWYPLSFMLQRLTELVQRLRKGVVVGGRV
jgi:tryptophan-rich sensory protein